MKVILDTPDRLVLRHIPIVMPLLVLFFFGLTGLMAWGYFRAGMIGVGLMMVGIGLVFALGTSPFWAPYWLTFDRPSGKLTLRRLALFGTRFQERGLAGLKGASTQMTILKRNPMDVKSRAERRRPDPKAWRAVLVYHSGRTEPLTPTYGPEREATTAAIAINGWVLAGPTL